MKRMEISERMEAIELTRDCVRREIEDIENGIEEDMYEEEEMEEVMEDLAYLNQIVRYLGGLRDNYYMWLHE